MGNGSATPFQLHRWFNSTTVCQQDLQLYVFTHMVGYANSVAVFILILSPTQGSVVDFQHMMVPAIAYAIWSGSISRSDGHVREFHGVGVVDAYRVSQGPLHRRTLHKKQNAHAGLRSAYGMYAVDVNAPSDLLTTSKVQYYRDSYFFKSRPQYEDLSVSDIINVKDYGATGDGVTDDTMAVELALADATDSILVYFPAGSYIITNGITVKPGTRMTGEVWSQLVASGDGGNFMDTDYPQPLIKIGAENGGDTGVVEISDMLFTSKGALPGLILMQWNIAADDQGSAGLWDAHFRIGGAAGTELHVAQCLKGATVQEGCIAVSMMLHITGGANGYFENMWAWVADHDLDDASNTMITVACARGILVESAVPTWMLGTASKHSILYQYNFYQSINVWARMIQTESPYFQHTESTESPGVFNDSVGKFGNDPIFPDSTLCGRRSYVQLFVGRPDILNYELDYCWRGPVFLVSTLLATLRDEESVCVDAQNYQQRLVNNEGANNQLYMFNLITIGAVEMLSDTDDGTIIYAANNTQTSAHPFWSVLGASLDDYSTEPHFCADDDTNAACFASPKCDYALSYATLEDLDAASGSWPAECLSYYILGTLNNLLSKALDNYTSVDDGYDSVYNYYVKAVKNEVPAALAGFMDPGSSEYYQVPYKQIDFVYAYTMTYTLEDSDGFYNELQSTYGIEKDWVTLGTWSNANNKGCGSGSGGGGRNPNLSKRCDDISIYYYNYPQVTGDISVSNPKDVVTAALPSIGNLQSTILARQMDLMMGQWTGPTDDLLQVISMPVFLLVQAVQAMQSAKEQAEAEKTEEDTHLALEILGIIFAFIPFFDDIAPAVEGLNQGFGLRPKQVGGHLTDVSLQHISTDITQLYIQTVGDSTSSSRNSTPLVPEDLMESTPSSDYRGRYGPGMKLASKSTSDIGASSGWENRSNEPKRQ
ncbi:hypothetical protein BJ170DRAFT_600500 [Xylariales sp. AK1849]|nr:hypothetical protein BJ170DRAFT_600500 [Xylariales sp. AK1849]